MWVILLWVVVMAGGIWWVTRGKPGGNGSTAALPVSAPAPAPPPQPGQEWKIGLIGNITMELVWIAPGNFTMGSPATEASRYLDEGPQMQVTLTKDFWLGKYPVTQQEWQAIMGANPSHFPGAGITAPVEDVSWDESMAFCKKLTDADHAAGRLPANYRYTLPTEAQWEYACRAGTTGPYAGNLPDIAWYAANSGNTTHPVGMKQPNAWGLYDMQGNVWQWCLDWYGPYPGGVLRDPTGPASGPEHVFRGGSWSFAAGDCRAASRNFDPGFRVGHNGLRLALVSAP